MEHRIPLTPGERAMVLARFTELFQEGIQLGVKALNARPQDRATIENDWPRIRDAMRWNAALLWGNVHQLELPSYETSERKALQMETLGEIRIPKTYDEVLKYRRAYLNEFYG